jgi:trimeric autotransporter adhesin
VIHRGFLIRGQILLTTGADDFPGTAGRDKFVGTISNLGGTLQATDKIDGGAGRDTLELTQSINWTGFSTGSVKNVETVKITNSAAQALTFNAKGIEGMESLQVISPNADFTVSQIGTGVKSISFDAGGKARDLTTSFDVVAPEVTSTTTAAALTLKDVGEAATTAGRSGLSLGSIQTINVTAQGSNFVNFLGATDSAPADPRSVTVEGSGNLNASFARGALATIDGSAATGNLSLDVSSANTTGLITSIKTGSGTDAITANMAALRINSAIDGGAGSNTFNLSGALAADTAVAYQLSNIGTLNLNALTGGQTLTISGGSISGLTTIGSNGTAATALDTPVSFTGMKDANLTFAATGSTRDRTITSDHSGTTTVRFADSTTAAVPLGDYTFTKSSAVTVNVGNRVDASTATTGVVVTAAKAASVNLNVNSFKVAGAETTEFGGTISAPEATTVVVNNLGTVGGTILDVAKATSVTITNGENAATANDAGFELRTGSADAVTDKTLATASKLQTLSITSASALTVESANGAGERDLVNLQNLTIAANGGAVLVSKADGTTAANLPAINNITLSGAATSSAVTLGALGGDNAYGLTLTASGLRAGLTTGAAITVTAGQDVSLDVSGVTGRVQFGTIGVANGGSTGAAKDVTIVANGSAANVAANLHGVTVGNITATGTVNINASGVKAPSIGDITGKSVTVNLADTVVNGTEVIDLGAITASTANLTLRPFAENTQTITAPAVTSDQGATSFNATVVGGILSDAITVNASQTGITAVNVSGDLKDGTSDTLVLNATAATAKTISVQNLANYERATINAGSGNDTITGGAGIDIIRGGLGKNDLTGGAGADVFVFSVGESNLANNSINRILDLQAIDKISYAEAGSHAVLKDTDPAGVTNLGTSASGLTGAGAGIRVTNGVVEFFAATGLPASGFDTLEERVAVINEYAVTTLGNIAGGDQAGVTAYFKGPDDKTYAWINTGTSSSYTTDVVVELVSVSLPSTAPTAATGTDNTGLIGVGA